ncbi:Me-53 [Euproctis pseudoconspersa nucleopolyhedrovirus]|uniref:Me-53 n=1 Tax=Euproctis pseudoconspersa nucleopolyhedrovirus TaxID=307467 RepID=C3TWS3_9ABAC|nr:Me-53 [Euproctis pseudoconspersa nucleopolyhedrovirus]ACO53465.1 Me-53 [Euproctis pseudoconspersa nucleopolyhedrovirus]
MLKRFVAEMNFNDDGTPLFDAEPQDLRPYFINKENIKLMSALAKFAVDYVKGVYKLNDLVLMNCETLKHGTDCIMNDVCCDTCKKEFRKIIEPELYCLIYKMDLNKNETSGRNKYKLVCGECAVAVSDVESPVVRKAIINQIYPILTLNSVQELCRHGFITKYVFKIDADDYVIEKKVFRDTTRNVYKSFCDIIRNKPDNEQIVSIKLLTYEKTLLNETSDHCFISCENDKKILRFRQSSSSMLSFVENHNFAALTHFYEVEKIVYANKNYDYVVYFAKPFFGYNKRLNCNKCKTKFYKSNIILYCSRCGFMNRMHFDPKIDGVAVDRMTFYPQCVRAKRNKYNCIIYYDTNVYNNIKLNDNKQLSVI